VYVPSHFAETHPERLRALMRAQPFATLVSLVGGELYATHVPLLLDPERGPLGTLFGHVAAENRHAAAFDGRTPALAIFHGPHAYVSPRWYAPGVPHVPSWNYTAVHATGPLVRVGDEARVAEILARSAATFEPADGGWTTGSVPEAYLGKMWSRIVAFEIPIARLEGKRKLSQNMPRPDRRGVIEALAKATDDDARAIAAEMEATLA
jgi:transcriptional regulator